MTDTAEAPITHPEEMRAGFDLQIGKSVNLKGNARITPAGIVTRADDSGRVATRDRARSCGAVIKTLQTGRNTSL